ncbi:hypothetical protein LTR85_002508 [Meristemomyces frigidus]|nr:hypothetical protein LTR85_002508 [Meristemomyces frigidus]
MDHSNPTASGFDFINMNDTHTRTAGKIGDKDVATLSMPTTLPMARSPSLVKRSTTSVARIPRTIWQSMILRVERRWRTASSLFAVHPHLPRSTHYAPATTLWQVGPSLADGDFTHQQDPSIEPGAQSVRDHLDILCKRQNTLRSKKATVNAQTGNGRGKRNELVRQIDLEIAESRDTIIQTNKALSAFEEEIGVFKAAKSAKYDAAAAKMEKAHDAYSQKVGEGGELAFLKEGTDAMLVMGKEVDAEVLYGAVKSKTAENIEAESAENIMAKVEAEKINQRAEKIGGNGGIQKAPAEIPEGAPGTGLTRAVKLTEVDREEGTDAKSTDEALQLMAKRRHGSLDVGRDRGKKAKTEV